MKIPKARRLPSGSWHIQMIINGKTIYITEPDKKTAERRALLLKSGAAASSSGNKTLRAAIDDYITARSNVLSPSTIRGYRIIQRNRFPELMDRRCADITEKALQAAINSACRSLSPKTVCNTAMFIKCVLSDYTGENYNISLPQVVPHEHPFLAPSQVPVFLEAVRGSNIEVPCLLGLVSLRASEMYALKYEDFDFTRRLIHVRGAAVRDENNNLVYKETNKNASSRRDVPMPARLAELVRPDAPIIPVALNTLGRSINRVCRENGLPLIGVHGLRHSFASFSLGRLGMSKDIVKAIGGWSDDTTLDRIYTHISAEERLAAGSVLLENLDALTGK